MDKVVLNSDYNISEEQFNLYDKNGFLFLNKVLTEDEVNFFSLVIDKAVEKRTSHDKRPLEQRSPYEREFLQCGHLWSEFPGIKSLTLSPRLGSIAKQLLKANNVRLWHDQALYKIPGGDATEPHQDLAYWPMLDRNAGTIWIALDEVTIEMGAMYFIPGSHKSGLDSYEHRIEDSLNKKINLIDEAKKIVKTEPVGYNLKPGDATFHHGLTVHYTGKNLTDKVRKGMTIIYFSDGVRYDENSPEAGHFCAAGSRHGEPIATKYNPIII